MPRARRGEQKIRYPEPRPWNERDPVLGSISGARPYILENLTSLLTLVGSGVDKNDVATWPDPRSQTTMGAATAPIGSSGLLIRQGQNVRLSADGKSWLESNDPAHLIAIFHANVRFIGEILNELNQKALSQVKLLDIAREKYGFGWTSGLPIFNRIKWLQAAGLVAIFSHRANISPAGIELLPRLAVYEPEHSVSSPTDLQPPPQAIQVLIGDLSRRHESRLRAGGLNIPGVKKNRGQLAAIRATVDTCASPTNDEVLIEKMASVFDTGPASAIQGLGALRSIGLLKRVSPTEHMATPAALAWAANPYNIDLARIVQANIWYFAEIIWELEGADRLSFAELLHRSNRYAKAGAYEPFARGGLTARLALLEGLGLIVSVSKGVYAATTLGSTFRRSVSCIDPVREETPSPAGDVSATEIRQSIDTSTRREAPETGTEAFQIAERLIHAARRSEKSVDLERAAIDALNFLGLPATHIGGSGEPDGIVRTLPGKLGSVFTVETKSAASGQVPEEQAKPATLAEHREQHDAEATLYIGPGFERRLLGILDNDELVAVVSTALIAETVNRQSDTPLTPRELRPLFDPSLQEGDRRQHLQAAWRAKEDWAVSMRGIIEVLSREAESPMSDEESGSSGLGWLGVTSIRRSLRDLLSREVSRELIGEILGFLSSPQAAMVEENDGRYRLAISSNVIGRHFEYLGRRWLVGNRTFKSSTTANNSASREAG